MFKSAEDLELKGLGLSIGRGCKLSDRSPAAVAHFRVRLLFPPVLWVFPSEIVAQ